MNSDSQAVVGETLFVGQVQKRDLTDALRWLSRAAANLYPRVRADAMFLAAWCLERGHGIESLDRTTARFEAGELLKSSLNHGFPLALVYGTLQVIAEGLELPNKAARFRIALVVLEDSAHDGDSLCQYLLRPFLLAEALEFGHFGLTPDLQAALPYYRLAETRGLVDAEIRLAALRSVSDASCASQSSS